MFRRFITVAGAMLVLTMILAACGEDELDATATSGAGTGAPADPTATEAPAPEQPDLAGTSWLLSGMDGTDLDSAIIPTLTFDDGQITGNAGCNDYGGEYTASTDGTLSFTGIYQTDKACEEGMDIEGEFLQLLQNVRGYTVDDTRLELTGDGGETLLVFMQDRGEGLAHTSWLLEEFQGEPIPAEFEDIRLTFEEDSAGGTVCNTYGGTYEVGDDGSLTISEVFRTEMYCTEPDGLMDLEDAYLAALENDVASYQIEGDRLTLLDASGNTVMVFSLKERADRQPLDGTEWAVVAIDGAPLIDGTKVTAEFVDGRVTGTGGCNSYGADYTASTDGTIDIQDAVMTLMACNDPEGVMDQETDFHSALREVTAWEQDGDDLRLLDDSGTVRLLLVNTLDPDAPVTDRSGTTWVLTAMNGQPVESDLPYTLQLSVNGPVGKAGCMLWSAQFRMESDGTITHETRVPHSTYDAFCDDDEDAIAEAEAYVEALSNAASYGDHLQLIDEDGIVTLEFRAGLDGGELDGTSWLLTELNGDPPLEGTSLTLAFDFEWATGEGGCNGFGGPYMVAAPGTVVFADVARTDMDCMDPEGIMDQESAYFDALLRVTGYELTDDSLTLLDADGETILVYERMP